MVLCPPGGLGLFFVLEWCRVLFQYEACKLNSQEVVEEDKRLKLPPNWEAKKARLEWELQVQEKKKVKNPHSPGACRDTLTALGAYPDVTPQIRVLIGS